MQLSSYPSNESSILSPEAVSIPLSESLPEITEEHSFLNDSFSFEEGSGAKLPSGTPAIQKKDESSEAFIDEIIDFGRCESNMQQHRRQQNFSMLNYTDGLDKQIAQEMEMTACVGNLIAESMEMTACVGNLATRNYPIENPSMEMTTCVETERGAALESMEMTSCVGNLLSVSLSSEQQPTIDVSQTEMEFTACAPIKSIPDLVDCDTVPMEMTICVGNLSDGAALPFDSTVNSSSLLNSEIIVPTFLFSDHEDESQPVAPQPSCQLDVVQSVSRPAIPLIEIVPFDVLRFSKPSFQILLLPSPTEGTQNVLRSFLEKFDVRFLDNIKSKARRETIAKGRDSELMTLGRQVFLGHFLIPELEVFNAASGTLSEVIEAKRALVASMEATFNANPPEIYHQAENDRDRYMPIFRSLKTSVRLTAKHDWRVFRLHYTKIEQKALLLETDQFETMLSSLTHLNYALSAAVTEASSLFSAHEVELDQLRQKEDIFSSPDVREIEKLAVEIASIKERTETQFVNIASLSEQLQTLQQTLAAEQSKSSSLSNVIELSKQQLEQHRAINQSELENRRSELNAYCEAFGFKISKLSSDRLCFSTREGFSILLLLTSDKDQKQFVSGIACDSMQKATFESLLISLLQDRITSKVFDNRLEKIFPLINLYVQRFERLLHHQIRRLQGSSVVSVSIASRSIHSASRDGSFVEYHFNPQLTLLSPNKI